MANAAGLSVALVERCLTSACSLRHYHRLPTPLFYILDEHFPAAAINFLCDVLNATVLLTRRSLRWPVSANYPGPPPRAYTFFKLRAWLLTDFQKVLYFDPDVNLGPPTRNYR